MARLGFIALCLSINITQHVCAWLPRGWQQVPVRRRRACCKAVDDSAERRAGEVLGDYRNCMGSVQYVLSMTSGELGAFDEEPNALGSGFADFLPEPGSLILDRYREMAVNQASGRPTNAQGYICTSVNPTTGLMHICMTGPCLLVISCSNVSPYIYRVPEDGQYQGHLDANFGLKDDRMAFYGPSRFSWPFRKRRYRSVGEHRIVISTRMPFFRAFTVYYSCSPMLIRC